MRAQIISTYALCGFSNLTSIGITIGGLSAICPAKRGTISKYGFRAMCAGCIACFFTACVAGRLFSLLNLSFCSLTLLKTYLC